MLRSSARASLRPIKKISYKETRQYTRKGYKEGEDDQKETEEIEAMDSRTGKTMGTTTKKDKEKDTEMKTTETTATGTTAT